MARLRNGLQRRRLPDRTDKLVAGIYLIPARSWHIPEEPISVEKVRLSAES
jgi:hypothetical protein